MTVSTTHIVGVESDANSVKIQFRPQGSDSADAPISIQIRPYAGGLFVDLNFAEFENGKDSKNLPIKPVKPEE